MTMAEDTIELGGKIQLAGFKDIEPGKLIVVKKVVGNYVRKIEEKNLGFESIHIHLKQVHNSEFEVQVKIMINGQPKNGEVTGNNLFVVLDKALNKVLEH